jgi:hypothetical protein
VLAASRPGLRPRGRLKAPADVVDHVEHAISRTGPPRGAERAGDILLGKQTLCQLSYSRSGGGGTIPCAREVTTSEPSGVPGTGRSDHIIHSVAA